MWSVISSLARRDVRDLADRLTSILRDWSPDQTLPQPALAEGNFRCDMRRFSSVLMQKRPLLPGRCYKLHLCFLATLLTFMASFNGTLLRWRRLDWSV
jgi:hypothetical protein